MHFFATGKVNDPEQARQYLSEEREVMAGLQARDVVLGVFRMAADSRLVVIIEADSLPDAEAAMGTLPFVERGLLSFDFAEATRL